MPKPSSPGSGHGKKLSARLNPKHGKTGWQQITISTGGIRSDPIPHEYTQHVVLYGQVYDSDELPIHGKDKPHARVEDNETESVITTSFPVTETVTFLYKIEDDEEDEESEAQEV